MINRMLSDIHDFASRTGFSYRLFRLRKGFAGSEKPLGYEDKPGLCLVSRGGGIPRIVEKPEGMGNLLFLPLPDGSKLSEAKGDFSLTVISYSPKEEARARELRRFLADRENR